MTGVDERKMREPVSFVEDDAFARLIYPARRPIRHHLVVTIDRWHASLLRRLPMTLKGNRSRRRYPLADACRNIRE
jgi:hypothetical protein